MIILYLKLLKGLFVTSFFYSFFFSTTELVPT